MSCLLCLQTTAVALVFLEIIVVSLGVATEIKTVAVNISPITTEAEALIVIVAAKTIISTAIAAKTEISIKVTAGAEKSAVVLVATKTKASKVV